MTSMGSRVGWAIPPLDELEDELDDELEEELTPPEDDPEEELEEEEEEEEEELDDDEGAGFTGVLPPEEELEELLEALLAGEDVGRTTSSAGLRGETLPLASRARTVKRYCAPAVRPAFR